MRLGMGRKKIRIGDILVAAGAITEEQLQEALAYQKENGGKLGNVLVDLGMISNEILITLLTQQLGIDYIELKGAKIEEKVIHMVPENMVAKYKVIPIEIDPENPNILKLAMSDPMDINAIDDIGLVTNMQVEPMLATEEQIMMRSASIMEAQKRWKRLRCIVRNRRMHLVAEMKKKQTKILIIHLSFFWLSRSLRAV